MTGSVVVALVIAVLLLLLLWWSIDRQSYPEIACRRCKGGGYRVKRLGRDLVRGKCRKCEGQGWFPRRGD